MYIWARLLFCYLLFVVMEELSQYFIPNRTLDITDLVADFFGIIVFSFITQLMSLYPYKSVEEKSQKFD